MLFELHRIFDVELASFIGNLITVDSLIHRNTSYTTKIVKQGDNTDNLKCFCFKFINNRLILVNNFYLFVCFSTFMFMIEQ